MKYLTATLLLFFMLAPLPIPPLPRAIAPQVHAATPDVCELVASPAGIDTYFCEPPGAPPFYENEFGFMQVVP